MVYNLEILDETVGRMGTSQKVTDWSIRILSEEDRNDIAVV